MLVTGDTNSTDFPVTSGAYDTTFNGNVDAIVAKFTRSSSSPGTLQFSASAYSVGEGSGQATVTVTRAGGSAGSVAVSYATSNGTAAAGSDYIARSGTLSWADGDSASKTFTVPITDDAAVEGNETVNLALSAPGGGATLGGPSAAVLTITDNDVPPPSPPSGLSASAVSSSRIDLVWTDASGNETGFKVERKTGAGGTWSTIATVGSNVSSFQNTGLSPGTQYFYRVRAIGAGGDSAPSNEATATTPAAGPDSDGDGLPDSWEQQHFGNLAQTGNGDPDADALNNGQEFSRGTTPTDSDTDDDGLTDGHEVGVTSTDPLAADTDGDGMADG
ncbi:MAG: Calx-beta domain-containing protein, partial [Actinomycetota bacterium]